jgi:hypothetical protein
MLALGPPPRVYEFKTTRDIPDFIRGAGGRFGFKKGAW